MQRFLERVAHFIGKHPIVTLLFSIILTGVSLYYALNLHLKSDLAELLPQDAVHVVNLKEISKEIGGDGYLIIAVQGSNLSELQRFADSLNTKLQTSDQIVFIYYKNNLNFIRQHALLFLSEKELIKIENYLQDKIESEGAKLNPFYVDLLAEEKPKNELGDFDKILNKYAFLNREYLTNNDGNLLILLVKPKEMASNILATRKLIQFVQKNIDELQPAGFAGSLAVQMSGRYFAQYRDNLTIANDLRSTVLISLVLIFLSLSFIFKKRRTFLIIGIPLLMGLAWTFGLTYFLIGELNLITTFLVAILLGLGINFGIHFFKRYLEFRESNSPENAIKLMYGSSVGISSITASLTTAAAFFSLIFTQFRGFNQFGIIAGTGAILTLVAYFLVFPSLIIIYERFSPIKDTATHLFPRLHFAEKLLQNGSQLRWMFYSLIILLFILIGFSTRLKFEYNFEALGTNSLEDYQLKAKINKLFQTSLSPAIVMVNSPEESRQTVQVIRDFIKKGSKTIASVNSLSNLVPPNQPERIQIIQRITELTQNKLFSFLEGNEKALFDQFCQYLQVKPLVLDSLPHYLTSNFRSQIDPQKEFVLIYSNIEQSDGKQVQIFEKELNSIQINGKPLKVSSESLILADIVHLMSRDGTIAILITIFSILFLIRLQFKRYNTTILVFLPIALGTISLLGIMGMLGIKFNFINLVALPIILGVGIDNSVHFYHRYKEDHSLWFAFYHTGMAMFLNTLTTVIGFGSLIFAQHRGLKTLGLVAVLGLIINLLTTFVILPVLLKINNFHSFQILTFKRRNGKPERKIIPSSKTVDTIALGDSQREPKALKM
ncbi:MMPL family transporter [candidate division KSB1 bacterium]|nr:MMPL family transporter [candidate division KSB1 bacterium]